MNKIKSVEKKNNKIVLEKIDSFYRVSWEKFDKEIHETHTTLEAALKTFDRYEKLSEEK